MDVYVASGTSRRGLGSRDRSVLTFAASVLRCSPIDELLSVASRGIFPGPNAAVGHFLRFEWIVARAVHRLHVHDVQRKLTKDVGPALVIYRR